MMKKLLFLSTLLCALAFAGCNKDNDTPTPVNTLTVTPLNGGEPYTWEGSEVNLFEEDGSYTLRLIDTRFVPQMPAMTLEIPGIAHSNNKDIISLSGDNLVPRMGGTPYEKYMVTKLSGSITNGLLNLTFNCMGFRVTFTGYEF